MVALLLKSNGTSQNTKSDLQNLRLVASQIYLANHQCNLQTHCKETGQCLEAELSRVNHRDFLLTLPQ